MKFWWAALLALPLLVGALVYGRTFICCSQTAAPSGTADNSENSECCPSDKSECRTSGKSECCPQEEQADAPKQGPVQGNDPDKQIVFKVEGLRCPAVKGIGCGHMLRPVLASLDKIDGVQVSSTNYTGTMIRVSVASANDRAKVAEEARKVLAENKPIALAGDELKRALEKEQWRETWRVGELSAIEFRTMGLYRIKTFAQTEKLDKATKDKLTKMAEDQWERLAQQAKKEKATQPEDWGNRCKKCIAAFLEQAKGVLTAEQLERFKTTLTTPCRGDDRPEAPPAPSTELNCSLTPDQLSVQRKQLLPGLFLRAARVEDIPNGLRFCFAHSPGLVTELAAIIEKERVCCRSLTFRLIAEKGEGPVTLEVIGPSGTAEMLRKLQTAGVADRTPPAAPGKEKNMTVKNTNPNLISLFGVPSLVCSAAPEIGCGPRAKPILLALQRDSNISEVWLNRVGTVLAVVGIEGSSRESRAKAVRAALEAKEEATATELEGEARKQELERFLSGDGWYRGAEVDTLSKQEAGIIAARLVRRIQAKVPLPGDKAKALESGFADAFNRCITSKPDQPQENRLQQYNEELLKVAQANLDEKGVGAFKEALAKGNRPAPNEK
jgi:hypothetical protein